MGKVGLKCGVDTRSATKTKKMVGTCEFITDCSSPKDQQHHEHTEFDAESGGIVFTSGESRARTAAHAQVGLLARQAPNVLMRHAFSATSAHLLRPLPHCTSDLAEGIRAKLTQTFDKAQLKNTPKFTKRHGPHALARVMEAGRCHR